MGPLHATLGQGGLYALKTLFYSSVGESDKAESDSLMHRHLDSDHYRVDALHGSSIGLD